LLVGWWVQPSALSAGSQLLCTNLFLPPSSAAGGKGTAQDKIKALEAAGVTVTNSPAQMGATMKRVMQERGLLG
jgi:succinyl-CoA synthetase alpha subunit